MTAKFIIDLLIGILLAAIAIFYYRKSSISGFKVFFSRTLLIAALIYVGFAVFGLIFGLADFKWLLIELGGVLIYGIFAYLGVKITPWFLAIGWATHVIWDVALHWSERIEFVPAFYPTACIGFDLIFAAFIVYRFFISDRT